MELDNNKLSYLQYYQKGTNSKSFNQSYNKQTSKVLPHIAQQYNFRITNNLLIKKIMDPKRDKIIKNSLQKTKKFIRASSSLKMRDDHNSKKRKISTSLNFRSGSIKRKNDKLIIDNSSILEQKQQSQKKNNFFMNNKTNFQNNVGEDFICESKLFNSTMKQRSKNTTYHLNSSKISSWDKQNSHHKSLHGRTTFNSDWFGSGPTILLISHLQIISNPHLKRDSLIQLELVQRLGIGKYILNNDEQISQKVIKTRPFSYVNLPDESGSKKIKFAIKVSKIGDFVPLRIWKYIGVDCIEIGTVDLPLNLYKIKTNFLQSEYHNLKWQFSKQSNEMGRRVLNGQVKCQLRKGKKIQINTKVIIKYKIYSKKLTKLKTPIKIDEQNE